MKKVILGFMLIFTVLSYAKMSAYESIVNECHNGDMKGCYELGKHFQRRTDTVKAMRYYEMACKNGYTQSCMKMGQMYHYGKGIKKNISKASTQYKRVLRIDPALGYYLLGTLEYSKKSGSNETALHYYTLACQKRNAEACSKLAYFNKSGINVAKDPVKSIAYEEKACTNDRKACLTLGDAYAKGESGVALSYGKAKKYYSLSCKGGSARACYRLGNLYYKGNGVKKSYVTAKKYYEKSCSTDMIKDGSERGCNNLAVLYRYGRGVKKDVRMSKKYYAKACKKGYAEACATLKSLK